MAACKVEDPKSIAEIRSKLESGLYKVTLTPVVLQIVGMDVYVLGDGLNQNLVQSLAGNKDWGKVRVLNNKLRAHGYGDYYLTIRSISTKYFESKEKFDSLLSYCMICDDEPTGDLVIVDKISLEQVLAEFDMTLAFDMEYYLRSQKDLDHKVQELDVNGKSSLNLLENQLFYREMEKIFGKQSVDENEETIPSVYFNDFRVLYSDGNAIVATALRGEHYFHFSYDTS